MRLAAALGAARLRDDRARGRAPRAHARRRAAGEVGILLGLAVPRRRLRPALPREAALDGPQAPGPAARARRALALLGRLRRDRLVDLLRARDRRAARASASRRSCCSASALLFLLVALSYAEATSALPETGGAATFVRRASNDLAGFMTGWVLFLDYLIVIALSALFVPHYLAGAFQVDALDQQPVGRRRRRRRDLRRRRRSGSSAAPPSTRSGSIVPALDVLAQLVLIVLRLRAALLAAALVHARHRRSGTAPTVHSLALRDPARDARLHRPRDGREPRRGGPPARRRPAALALRRDRDRRHRLRRDRRRRALGVPGPAHRARHAWLRSPLVGIADADPRPHDVGARRRDPLLRRRERRADPARRRSRRRSPASRRLAYSLGEHGQLPRAFGRLHRRTLVSPQAIVSATVISSAIVIALGFIKPRRRLPRERLLVRRPARVHRHPARGDQAADRPSPTCRGPTARRSTSRSGGAEIPLPAIVGALLTFAVWVLAIATHPGARYAGPVWLADRRSSSSSPSAARTARG